MKKTMIKIATIIFLLSLFMAGTCLAQSDYATISGAKAFINENGQVVVSGNISSGPGKQVAVAIIDPVGSLEYTNSAISTIGGGFAFSYTMANKTPGTYVARLGGSGVVYPVSVTFYAPVAIQAVSAFLSGNRRVEVSGTITAGADRQITIEVTDPAGRFDYVNSTFSQDDGRFTFSYPFTNTARGVYHVKIGGQNVAYPACTSFCVGCLSNDATLQNLELTAGFLEPFFAPGTTDYKAVVPLEADGVAVIPTTTDSSATVKVQGEIVASGSESSEIILANGANTIDVVVTAQDGVTTKTYTINIPRQVILSDVTATINPDRQVNISGVISSGEGRVVSVMVAAPNGCSDYINSTFSTFGGNFNFSYLLSGSNGGGTYTVKVGGEKTNLPAMTSFVYTPPISGGGSEQYLITIDHSCEDGFVIKTGGITSAAAGTKITLTVDPVPPGGGAFSVSYGAGNECSVNGDNTFIMPAADVMVSYGG